MLGISYNELLKMTPRILHAISQGYAASKQEEIDHQYNMAYIYGVYSLEALRATVGNLFLGKGKKPYDYPDKPIDFKPKHELSEEEKQREIDKFYAEQTAMRINFQRNKREQALIQKYENN